MNDKIYHFLLSENTKEKAEKVIIWASIASFIIHLIVIALVNAGIIHPPVESELLTNPISAIYTPFSFILLFEVYLLVYHIPFSTSDYIAKQYEIITLIVIRRIFKDLSHLELSTNWFQDINDLIFTYDIITALLLFLLIYFFLKLSGKKEPPKPVESLPARVRLFIKRKKIMAMLLVPVIIVMAVYAFVDWFVGVWGWLSTNDPTQGSFIDINKIFFDEFFTVLILTDVLLLLFSFFHTTRFHVFIRNSGFIISTVLIRISFSIDGIVNNALILVAVLFGVLILLVTNQYAKVDNRNLEV